MTNEEKLKIIIEAQNRAKAAFDEANRQIEGTSKKFDKISDKLDKVATKMKNTGKRMTAFVTLPIVAGAGVSINAFSDLQETMSKTEVTFADQADAIKDWSNTSIDSMGLAQQSALDAVSLFGDMGVGMGQTTEDAAEMSTKLTELAADMSSFKNVSFERSQTALAGVYTGETEALKSLGVVMTEANLKSFAMSQGFQGNIKDLTQEEKVFLRYRFVLDKTANAQGDFARTSDSIANRSRKTKERMKQLSAEVGEKLAPIMNKLLDVGNRVLDWFSGLTEGQTKAVLAIAGFVAALGPAIFVIGNLISAIRGIAIAFSFLGAHPIILIIIGITAAIAGAAFLIMKNWDTLKKWFGTFWTFMKKSFSSAFEFIKRNWITIVGILTEPLGTAVAIIVKNWGTIKNVFGSVVRFIKDQFVGAKDTVVGAWNTVVDLFKNFASKVGGGLSRVKDVVSKPFTSAFDAIKRFWNNSVGKLSFKAPDWVPGIGGKGWSMPTLFRGARNFGGGPAIVGDVNGRGGEIVNVPRGSDVFTNRESKQILRNLAEGKASGRTIQITNHNTFMRETDPLAFARLQAFELNRR